MIFELVACTVYWGIIQKNMHHPVKKVCRHIIPLLCLIVEFCLVGTPFSMRHYLPTAVLGITYLTLNFILSKYNNIVYKILSWDSIQTASLLSAIAVCSFLFHLIFVFVSKQKLMKFRNTGNIIKSKQD